MKRLLPSLLALLSLPAFGQFIQPVIQGNSGNAQTCATGNVTNGNVEIVGAHTEGTLTGISSTHVTTWTLIDSSTANSITTRVWAGAVTSSGSETVTVTGTSSFNGISCTEIDGSLYTATADVHTNGGFTGTPSSVTTASVTPNFNEDFYYSYIAGFKSAGVFNPILPLQWLSSINSNDSGASGFKILGISGSGVTSTFNNSTNTQGNYVVVTLKSVAIKIAATAFPTGLLGSSYSYTIPIVGGAGAYTWSVTAGTLPYGLSLGSSTGTISGTPTSGPTSSSITFQATDGTHTATAPLTLTINTTASTPAYVQTTTGTSGACGSQSTTTVGDVMILYDYVAGTTGSSFATPTDTLGSAWKIIALVGNLHSLSGYMEVAAAVMPSTASNTVSGHSGAVVVCDRFSGSQGFFDANVFTQGTSAATSTITSNSITTPTPNAMLEAGAMPLTTTATMAAVSPFTLGGSASAGSGNVITEFNLESSAGSYTPSFTQTTNTNTNWIIGAVALWPSTSGTLRSPVRNYSTVY